MLIQLLSRWAQLANGLVSGELIQSVETVEAAPATRKLLDSIVQLVQMGFVLTPCLEVDVNTKGTLAFFVEWALFDKMLPQSPLVGLLRPARWTVDYCHERVYCDHVRMV